MQLSEEQKLFVQKACEGKNVFVDACIGSGKTTAIQHLCDALPANKKILYLTYNKLLKIDAKSKIRNRNAMVTNYHGFAYCILARMGMHPGISDLIQTFISVKPKVYYDVLIIDEYQDIEQELAEMLEIIKESNPRLQIVAVGDMAQKIYDKTTLDIQRFMEEFLGDYEMVEFTQCFRLNREHAAMLGRVWDKTIVGVNSNCKIQMMPASMVISFLAEQNPSDILCLGSRTGLMADVLNKLETRCSDKFNKHTIYASITDKGERAVEPTAESGIFTTFDSSKGLERKICVVFDFDETYWLVRSRQPQQSYNILRNIFCVAASRGKEKIIFVTQTNRNQLTERMLCEDLTSTKRFVDVNISEMFDFKFKEDVEDCYKLLDIKKLDVEDINEIKISNKDGLIDLSPCIGIYQEARFFEDYDVDKEIKLALELMDNKKSQEEVSSAKMQRDALPSNIETLDLEKKILYLTTLETRQYRYFKQVETPFVEPASEEMLCGRLATIFTPDEAVQERSQIEIVDNNGNYAFTMKGICDVLREKEVWELKFMSALQHENFLQCAGYMISLKKEIGYLWNVRDNSIYEIHIPDRQKFMNAVVRTVTKGAIYSYRDTTNLIEKSGKPGDKLQKMRDKNKRYTA